MIEAAYRQYMELLAHQADSPDRPPRPARSHLAFPADTEIQDVLEFLFLSAEAKNPCPHHVIEVLIEIPPIPEIGVPLSIPVTTEPIRGHEN